MKAKVVTDMN